MFTIHRRRWFQILILFVGITLSNYDFITLADTAPGQIIDTDDRVQITGTAITQYPWTALVRVKAFNLSLSIYDYTCSGTLITPNVVLTAAHCILYEGKHYTAGDITVTPAQDGASNTPPFGTFAVTEVFIPSEWETANGYFTSDSVRFDYAVLKLAANHPIPTDYIPLKSLTDSELELPRTYIHAGYPGDKPTATLWSQTITDTVYSDAGRLYAPFDAYEGQSGGPLFAYENGHYHLVGVESGFIADLGVTETPYPVTTFIRMRQRMLDDLQVWLVPYTLALPGMSPDVKTRLISRSSSGGSINNLVRLNAISPDGRLVAVQTGSTNLPGGSPFNAYTYDLDSGDVSVLAPTYDFTNSGYWIPSSYIEFVNGGPVYSGDNRYVVFDTATANVVEDDTNSRFDVFLSDLQTRTNQRISKGYDGSESDSDSYGATISTDGTRIAFISNAHNLVPNDTNNCNDVFVYDRNTGSARIVTLNPAGQQICVGLSSPQISGDGRWVAYAAKGTVMPGDPNDLPGVYLFDLQTNSLSRITHALNNNGIPTDGYLHSNIFSSVRISSDGRFIVYVATAYNLLPQDGNKQKDVYLYDNQTHTTSLISAAYDTLTSLDDGESPTAALSQDGRFITFSSTSPSIVRDDRNSASDVFVYDRILKKMQRISLRPDGSETTVAVEWQAGDMVPPDSYGPSITADGSAVSYTSVSNELVPDDANLYTDVFVTQLHAPALTVTNDAWNSAITLTDLPFWGQVYTPSATASGDDPASTCTASSSKSVWYRYTAAQNGTLRLSLEGSDSGAALTVYTGTAPGGLSEVGCTSLAQNVSFQINVAQSTTYWIVARGDGLVNFSAAPASLCDLTANSLPELISALDTANEWPLIDTICLNANSTYTISSGFNPTSSYVKGLPSIRSPITILGNGATINVTPWAMFLTSVLSTGSLTLKDLTLINANFDSSGTIILDHVQVTADSSINYCGDANTSLTIKDSVISDPAHVTRNTPIYFDCGTLQIERSRFTDLRYGAISSNSSGSITVIDTEFDHMNPASEVIAANGSGNMLLQGLNFHDNTGNGISGIHLVIQDSRFSANTGVLFTFVPDSDQAIRVSNSCIVGNTSNTGPVVVNQWATDVDMRGNWWGDPGGPSGAGEGAGDAISAHILYDPVLTEPPSFCAGDIVVTLPSPELLLPDDGLTTINNQPTLSWAAVEGAVSYQVQLDTAQPFTVQPTATTDTQFTVTAPLPDGWYYWRVRAQAADGHYSAWSAVRQFKIDQFVPNAGSVSGSVYDSHTASPLSGIHVRLVSLDQTYGVEMCTDQQGSYSFDYVPFDLNFYVVAIGSGICGNISYGFEYWLEAPDEASATTLQLTLANPTLSNINFSLDMIELVAPTLLAPADGAHGGQNPPVFEWLPVAGADHYEIQLGRNQPFTAPIQSVMSTIYQPYALLLTTDYYWRVRAVGAAQNYSDWSQTRRLTMDSAPGDAPVRNLVTTPRPTLFWNRVTWATAYYIQISNNPRFNNPDDYVVSSNVFSITSQRDLPNGVYVWRVSAQKPDGSWSNWSAPEVFTIDVP